ncbi:MAG: type II and III secretion system protein family protein [Alphaproteobacteria bacterium]|nr:type II and III secretion system protein family protein [Alphaproteobacteria bacterium]MBV9370513.1 type II and III secretion system protein family protein [Alphaproteobacteria bacterium]MBV9901414.1 type II and III secretion system protein family protein [Alphaproteobacteria bacterium]
MKKLYKPRQASLATVIAALIGATVTPLAVAPAPALAQPAPVRPSNDMTLSVGTGRMVRLDAPMSDLFVANDAIADVQVRSANQIYVFGKTPGETTVFATDKAGRTIWSANVRVGTNLGSLDELLRVAMPEAQIQARPINGMVLLTGTVAAPADVEEATRIVQTYVGTTTQVISRLKTATPLQVMLQVKIAEVNRSIARDIGFNLLSRDHSGGFLFSLVRGRNAGTIKDIVSPTLTDPVGNPLVVGTDYTFNAPSTGSSIGAAGHLLGLDLLSSLDLAENQGLVTTLAEPNLTALSGETASFLAGGEFPIVTSSNNGTSVEYKSYGVSLAFTPTVLEGGRISMRVRPEVSQLTSQGAIKINNLEVPALTTRRAETTVELGSGQSFAIGGLLQNGGNNSVERTPFLGNLPILGALFRSKSFRRNETELVIVVTPYLVRPVNASQIALPTDGYRTTSPGRQVLLDQDERGVTGARRPGPTVAPPRNAAPGIGRADPPAPLPAAVRNPQTAATKPESASAAPGFSFQ